MSMAQEVDDNGTNLLHHATVYNQTAAMQYVIDYGVHRDAVDNDRDTCISSTSHSLWKHQGSSPSAIDNGATDTVLNKARDVPLHITVRIYNPRLVQAFICHPQIKVLPHPYCSDA